MIRTKTLKTGQSGVLSEVSGAAYKCVECRDPASYTWVYRKRRGIWRHAEYCISCAYEHGMLSDEPEYDDE